MTMLTQDSLLTREAAAQALCDRGFPATRTGLATLASRGGGPAYRTYGRRAIYKLSDLIEWAELRLSSPRHTTSEV